MKTKKGAIKLAMVLVLWCVCVPAVKAGIRVLVVPSRYSVLQVAFDMAHRHHAVLVSYQGEVTSDSPQLHYWNGVEWMRMSVDDYAQARFLRSLPDTFIIVGSEDMLPPVLVSGVASWCPDVQVIPSVDTPSLLNAFGKAFSFSSHEWEWFARRYNLQLEDKHEELRRQSWYDRNYYEDEWSGRWQWLRRKHNVPDAGPGPTTRQAPAAPADVYIEHEVLETSVAEPWPVAADHVWEEQEPLQEPEPMERMEIEIERIEIEEEAYPVK